MWYQKNEPITNSYNYCTEKYDDSFVKMDDNLFSQGFDGCFYLKSFLENPDEFYLLRKQEQEIYDSTWELKKYLNETDYVISKLNELKLEDEEEYESEKEKYSEVLAKRKEARNSVREMENKLPELQARLDELYKQK